MWQTNFSIYICTVRRVILIGYIVRIVIEEWSASTVPGLKMIAYIPN